jgi:hypothetical protein
MEADIVFFGESPKTGNVILAAIREIDSGTHDL